jgi:hypothetical protein
VQAAIERSEWGQGSKREGGAFSKYSGWKALGKDVFNRMGTVSDSIGDWMWHMSPWADAAVQYGAGKVTADLQRGDEDGAALKAAFLTHYVVDPLAVSHAWLYLIGEIWEWKSDEVLHKDYHDPVENLVGKHLDEVALDPPAMGSFAELYPKCVMEAFHIGVRILKEFRGAKNYLPLVKEGVRNSARCMPAFLDGLHESDLWLLGNEGVEWAAERWMARLFLDWEGERIRRELLLPATIAALKKDMGYEGSDIFFHPERCSGKARQDFERFREARAGWRKRIGLPPIEES